ncbi:MAG: alpha/beta hydrolase [Desulfamplus sp.]|nr:alpha/beta hydrolase [Desulfamplus sp.]
MMSISPIIKEWLDKFYTGMEVLKQRGFQPTPENTREGMCNLTRSLVLDKPDIPLIIDSIVTDCTETDFTVSVRIYHPDPNIPLPVLIYYHGGGHMAGSVSVYDPICRKIAFTARHIVVAVEYRLAPEYPYPAGVQDAYHVAKNIWTILDLQKLKYIDRLCLAGDSAGGALCATVSHMSQSDPKMQIACQVLIYPSLDYTMSFPSIDENEIGYLLEKDKIKWYFDNYFQKNKGSEAVYPEFKAASPLFMEITPHMPATLVITAQFCPLRDEGIAYVKRLGKAGIHTEHLHFDNMIHAFLNMESLVPDECIKVYRKISDFLESFKSR